jgi:hypothetical protein
MMNKNWKYEWRWCCDWEDPNHGCYNVDYEGRCMAKSHIGFETKEGAEKAAKKHVKKYPGHTTHVWRERKYFIKTTRRQR